VCFVLAMLNVFYVGMVKLLNYFREIKKRSEKNISTGVRRFR